MGPDGGSNDAEECSKIKDRWMDAFFLGKWLSESSLKIVASVHCR